MHTHIDVFDILFLCVLECPSHLSRVRWTTHSVATFIPVSTTKVLGEVETPGRAVARATRESRHSCYVLLSI